MSTESNEFTYEWNEFEYAKEFNGNLHGQIDPARVTTTVHTMSKETAREVQLYRAFDGAPRYNFRDRYDLPMHPSLEATGPHYFGW